MLIVCVVVGDEHANSAWAKEAVIRVYYGTR